MQTDPVRAEELRLGTAPEAGADSRTYDGEEQCRSGLRPNSYAVTPHYSTCSGPIYSKKIRDGKVADDEIDCELCRPKVTTSGSPAKAPISWPTAYASDAAGYAAQVSFWILVDGVVPAIRDVALVRPGASEFLRPHAVQYPPVFELRTSLVPLLDPCGPPVVVLSSVDTKSRRACGEISSPNPS